MSRKSKKVTEYVSELKDTVNNMLSESVCCPDVRVGMCSVLETALNSAGEYKGFKYLTSTSVPSGQKPGINTDKDGFIDDLSYEEKFNNTDDTRRYYF